MSSYCVQDPKDAELELGLKQTKVPKSQADPPRLSCAFPARRGPSRSSGRRWQVEDGHLCLLGRRTPPPLGGARVFLAAGRRAGRSCRGRLRRRCCWNMLALGFGSFCGRLDLLHHRKELLLIEVLLEERARQTVHATSSTGEWAAPASASAAAELAIRGAQDLRISAVRVLTQELARLPVHIVPLAAPPPRLHLV